MHNWKAKQRPRRQPQGQHGPIKRIVGNTPMISFGEALEQHFDMTQAELDKWFLQMYAQKAELDKWFLQMYAQKVREGQERTLDIPSIIADVLDGIASRIKS